MFIMAFFNKANLNSVGNSSTAQLETSLYATRRVAMVAFFTSTLSSGNDNLLDDVSEIFFSENITSNLITLTDPMGHVQCQS